MKLAEVLTELEREGVRITSLRKEILSHILREGHPISAPEILKELTSANINKTTVYRFLDILLEKKIIKQVFISPERIAYESNYLPHHHHITCTKCGSIDEVSSPSLEKVVNKVENEVGSKYKVNNHVIEFYGVCKTCQ